MDQTLKEKYDDLRIKSKGFVEKVIEEHKLLAALHQMRRKEEEQDSIIKEYCKICTALREKLAKEESEKSAALVLLTQEKDARLSAERSQVSVMKELERAQKENSSANEKISFLNDMLQECKRLLERYKQLFDLEHEALNAVITSRNETMKLKEALECEVGCLRLDLQVKDDRDRVLTQVQDLSAELGNLMTKSDELEETCSSQTCRV